MLPIVHLNGFKISSPTIFATMSDEELDALFSGYGYVPLVVDVEADRRPRRGDGRRPWTAPAARSGAIQREARAGGVTRGRAGR